MTRKEYVIEFAKKELSLTGFDKSPLGQIVLDFLETSCDLTDGDPEIMLHLTGLVGNLTQCLPIAEITENDFEPEVHEKGDQKITIMRCTRYPFVYKMPDGKYYDDRAIAFRYSDESEVNKMYLYQSQLNSKQEVTLPYLPSFEVQIIPREANEL